MTAPTAIAAVISHGQTEKLFAIQLIRTWLATKGTAPSRTSASDRSSRRSAMRSVRMRRSSRTQLLEGPLRVLTQHRVRVLSELLHHGLLCSAAAVPKCDERVATQVARVVGGHVQAVEPPDELVALPRQPLDERDVRCRVARRLRPAAALLDAAVPRAQVLADVAAVDLRAELRAVLRRDRLGRLGPVGEALRRVEGSRLVERAGRAGIDAERAGAAIELERRRRLDLDVGDQRSEDDPGTVAPRDQHRVLSVE